MSDEECLRIGDKMIFSVELIEILKSEDSVPVVVADISQPDADGIKTVTLKREQ